MPQVSVLMSVHNGQRHLTAAINSILAQSFDDFEFIIINDGSTDDTATLLHQHNDRRLSILHQPRCKGLSYSLNKALAMANGTFLARMDADDIAHPQRLAKQLAYMRRHPNVSCVGTEITYMDENGTALRTSLNDGILRQRTSGLLHWQLLWLPPLAHPAWMIRRRLLVQHHLQYDERFLYAQDYDLLHRLAQHAWLGVVPEPLLFYRQRTDNISNTYQQQQLAFHYHISRRALQSLLGRYPRGLHTAFHALVTTRHPLISTNTSTRQLLQAVYLVKSAYQCFAERYNVSRFEHAQIQQDVLNKIGRLASTATHHACYPASIYGWLQWWQLGTWHHKRTLLHKGLGKFMRASLSTGDQSYHASSI